MNLDIYLGMKFSASDEFPPNTGILEVFEDLEEGDQQEYYIEGKNGEWQFLLSEDSIITTIFIFPHKGGPLINGVGSNWTRKDVINKLGNPESSGEITDSPFLGKKGAWDRFYLQDYYLHIEYTLDGKGIEKQTLMLPEVVP